jgi:hypothetical protein
MSRETHRMPRDPPPRSEYCRTSRSSIQTPYFAIALPPVRCVEAQVLAAKGGNASEAVWLHDLAAAAMLQR